MTRRHFIGSAAACLHALGAKAQDVGRSGRGPFNLLYILTDQHSGLAIPGEHDPYVQMPNLARLASGGVSFTRAYTAGVTCGPSRASLFTGLSTQTHGVRGGAILAEGIDSLPRILNRHGYISSHPDGYNLEADQARHEQWLRILGYSDPLSALYGSEAFARYLPLPLKWKVGRSGVAPEHAYDAFIANRALRFLEANRDNKFVCFVQFRGPHDPYAAPRPYDSQFTPRAFAIPPYRRGEFEDKPVRQRESFHTQGADRMTDGQIQQVLGLYYGMLAYTDHYVGQVLTRLYELGLADKTVVAYVSDHGDTMGCHRMFSKDFGFYEPAVRIPMVFRAPGGRPRGLRVREPVSGIDHLPTLLELLELPPAPGIHGRSLVPAWEGRNSDLNRTIFAGQGYEGYDRMVMLWTPRYKLTRYDDGGSELYDLERDPDELTNAIHRPEYASTVRELSAQLRDWDGAYPHREPTFSAGTPSERVRTILNRFAEWKRAQN